MRVMGVCLKMRPTPPSCVELNRNMVYGKGGKPFFSKVRKRSAQFHVDKEHDDTSPEWDAQMLLEMEMKLNGKKQSWLVDYLCCAEISAPFLGYQA